VQQTYEMNDLVSTVILDSVLVSFGQVICGFYIVTLLTVLVNRNHFSFSYYLSNFKYITAAD